MRFRLLLLCIAVSVSLAHVAALPVTQSDRNDKTIDVGEVNKKALKIPLVSYPRRAAVAGVYGIVQVRVWINKKGDVIRTAIISGPRLLRRASLESARGAKFPPNLGDCESCRHVTGLMVYTFNKPNLPQSKR